MCDLLHLAGGSCIAAAERLMKIPEVVAARHAALPRPSWAAIMTKAFAIAAQNHPCMRRFYCSFPWGHLVEYEYSIGSVVIDRRIDDEDFILRCSLTKPEEQSLAALDGKLRRYGDDPIESIGSFRALLRFARIPWPFRRFVFWLGLQVFPRRRSRHFGTFGVTTMSSYGAKTLQVPSIWGALLHYGTINDSGEVPVAIAFDHRVMDGREVGFALLEMEQALRHDILEELESMRMRVLRAA